MRVTVVVAIGLIAAPAAAQMSSSNCIAMGGGMVHCDTMQMGGARASGGDDFSTVKAILAIKAHSLRAKVGKMVAAGDCRGAATYAMQKGDFDLVRDVQAMCSLPTSAAPATAALAAPAKQLSPYEAGKLTAQAQVANSEAGH